MGILLIVISFIVVFITISPTVKFFIKLIKSKEFSSNEFLRYIWFLLFFSMAYVFLIYEYEMDIFVKQSCSFILLFSAFHIGIWIFLFFLWSITKYIISAFDKLSLNRQHHHLSNNRLSKLIKSYFDYADYSDLIENKANWYNTKNIKISLVITYFIGGFFVLSPLTNSTYLYIYNKSEKVYEIFTNFWNRDLSIYSSFFLLTTFTVIINRIMFISHRSKKQLLKFSQSPRHRKRLRKRNNPRRVRLR